jgi:hypothetical protein
MCALLPQSMCTWLLYMCYLCPVAPPPRRRIQCTPRTCKHRLRLLGTNLAPGREQGPAGGKREVGGRASFCLPSPLCLASLPALRSYDSSEIAVSSALCFAVIVV